jgi:hypothetical protein
MYLSKFLFLGILLFAVSIHPIQTQSLNEQPYPLSPHVLPLWQKPVSPSSLSKRDNPSIAPLRVGASYLVNITFGTQTLPIEIDTGSTDLWVVSKGFICVDFASGKPTSESACKIPHTYTISDTFKKINDDFNTEYADGEFSNGLTGYERITIAGLTVPQQLMGAVTNISWLTGDGYSAGVVGFGFVASPDSISAHSIPSSTQDTNTPNDNPLITNLYTDNLIPPIFSLALNRSQGLSGGVLALGGIPPVTYTPPFATTPLTNPPGPISNGGTTQTQLYTITLSGITFTAPSNSSNPHPQVVTNSTPVPGVVLDTGTPPTYLPLNITRLINAAFDPPGHDIGGGLYSLSCAAIPPTVGIIIGNDTLTQTFYMDAADLISGDSSGGTGCWSNIINGDNGNGSSDYILGGTFLNNVLAVFDLGEGVVSLASRGGVDTGSNGVVTAGGTASATASPTKGGAVGLPRPDLLGYILPAAIFTLAMSLN